MQTVADPVLDDLRTVVSSLAAAWNAMDADAFARLFVEDATFVDIKANRDEGRAAIRHRHAWLFDTVFRDTHIRYDLLDARTLGPDLVLGHVGAHVSIGGKRLDTLSTCVFRHAADGWQLASFHNTQLGQYEGHDLPG